MKLNPIDAEVLDKLYIKLESSSKHLLGYPCCGSIGLYEDLARFLKFTINNVGDPFMKSNYLLNSMDLELEVLRFFASLFKINDYWGYVTNGGTEGNMFGLYLAREKFPEGIVYYSEDTHYSIRKTTKILRFDNCLISSLRNGEINYDDLKSKLVVSKPAVLNLNIGTTMKGAIDNVEKVLSILDELKIRDYYIHCDTALFGMILPFLKESPKIDFDLPINSLAISGHKFLGSPIPCGVVLCRKNVVDCIRSDVEYIGSSDATISGSRDGFSVIILWSAIKKLGLDGIKQLVENCMAVTEYAEKKLKSVSWPCWKNDHSNILIINKPKQELVRKWSLATQGSFAHLVIMPHVTRQMIDEFVSELSQ